MKSLINYKYLSPFSASEVHKIHKEVAKEQSNPLRLTAVFGQPVCTCRTTALHPPGT